MQRKQSKEKQQQQNRGEPPISSSTLQLRKTAEYWNMIEPSTLCDLDNTHIEKSKKIISKTNPATPTNLNKVHRKFMI